MGFTLRQLKANGAEFNSLLGDEYTVYHISKSEAIFKQAFKDVFEEDYNDKAKCYAIILAGKSKFPLYLGDQNYIVTESGKTFANISY